MDSPSGDGMNTYVVSKMTRNAGITVAMSGLSGDEVFAGYDYFSKWLRMKRSGSFALPVTMRKLVANYMARGLSDIRHARMQALALSDGSIRHTYPAFRQIFSQQKVSALTSRIHTESDSISKPFPLLQNGFGLLSQFSIGEMTNYTLNVLLKDTDQFSMASSLEVREPFFDYKLVDYVMHLPEIR
jgi:asparagine synthase (glutamine-hydrolysing)